MPHHVFLSYSRKDSALMQRIWDDLRAQGLTVWTDEGIEPGIPLWDQAIEDALKNSGCMVVILTPNAVNAKGLRDEIHYANIHKVRIFPLLAQGSEQTAILYPLSGTQWTDIRTDYQTGLQKLTTAIRKYLKIENISQDYLPFDPIILEPQPPVQPPQIVPPKVQTSPQQISETASSKVRTHQIPVSDPETTPVSPDLPPVYLKVISDRYPAQSESQPPSTQLPISEVTPALEIKPLIPWLPWNQFRLLWWIFIQPGQFIDYRKQVDENVVKKAGTWLSSSLAWLPLFIPILAAALNKIPVAISTPLNTSFMTWSGIITLAWLLTAWFGHQEGDSTGGCIGGLIAIIVSGFAIGIAGVIAGGLAFSTASGLIGGVAFGIAFGVAGGVALLVADVIAFIATGSVLFATAFGIAFIVAFGIASGITFGVIGTTALVVAFFIADFLQNSFKVSQPSFLNKLLFILLILSYAVLIWIYWFGGWRYIA